MKRIILQFDNITQQRKFEASLDFLGIPHNDYDDGTIHSNNSIIIESKDLAKGAGYKIEISSFSTSVTFSTNQAK